MKIEKQVCTLEQAKKLKSLGIIGNTNTCKFFWLHFPETKYRREALKLVDWGCFNSATDRGEHWGAFTLAELGQMLPSETGTQRNGSEDSQYANWEWADDGNQLGMGMFETEAEARADMLITLIEKKLLDVQTCNDRLLE